MEFKFNVQGELFCNKDGYSSIKLSHLLDEEYVNTNLILEVILKMRQLLQKNIGVNIPSNLSELPSDSRIYIKAFENKCYGYLIVSDDPLGTGKVKLHEIYVYEPYQKFGHGKSLFDKMLQVEIKAPTQVLIDQPTFPLQRFMKKHFVGTTFQQNQINTPSDTFSFNSSHKQKNSDFLSNVGRQMLMSGNQNQINYNNTPQYDKTKSFSGLRPRPDYIPDNFGKHYSLFGSHFNNVSTNPSKYDPQRQQYDFQLDFSLVKGNHPQLYRHQRSNENSLERESSQGLYESQHFHSGSLTNRGDYGAAGHKLGNSMTVKDLLSMRKDELNKMASPHKIGLAKVALIQPHNLNDGIKPAPQAPFATFERENHGNKQFFRTGDKQSIIQI